METLSQYTNEFLVFLGIVSLPSISIEFFTYATDVWYTIMSQMND